MCEFSLTLFLEEELYASWFQLHSPCLQKDAKNPWDFFVSPAAKEEHSFQGSSEGH